jgi:hypothetical protein
MLVIMRGLAGSGKSTLAKQIAEEIGAKICSADYFFNKWDSIYNFNPKWLGLAHLECQYEAYDWIGASISNRVVVDNTNIKLEHMKIYEDMVAHLNSFNDGSKYDDPEVKIRYIIPNTSWAFDPIECHKRCTHGVPLETIERMARQFEKHPKDEVGWS